MIAPRPDRRSPRGDRYLTNVIGRWFRSPVRTLSFLGLALALTFILYWIQPSRFEARSDVVVVAIPSFSIQGTLADMSVDSAAQLLTSDQVLGTTARTLGYPGGPDGLLSDLIISPVVNSRILRLYVRNESPDLALQAIEHLSDGLLRERSARLERTSEKRLEEIRARLAAINAEVDVITANGDISASGQEDLAILVDERTALEGEMAGIAALPTEAGFIARSAQVSADPQRPYAPVYVGSGLAVGLCVAWFAAPAHRTRANLPVSGGTR